MKNKINIILEQQNKSMYWLSKVTGISYKNIHNLCNEDNPIKSIKLNTIDKICTALDCTPNELFEPDIDLKTLMNLYKDNPTNNIAQTLRNKLKSEYPIMTNSEVESVIDMIPNSFEITINKDRVKMNINPLSLYNKD